MIRLYFVLLFSLGLLAAAELGPEVRQQAKELLRQYREAKQDSGRREKLVAEMLQLDPGVAELLAGQFDKEWRAGLETYRAAIEEEAHKMGGQVSGRKPRESEARKKILDMAKLKDDDMKKALAQDGWRLMEFLRGEKEETPTKLPENGKLGLMRKELDLLRLERNRCVKAAGDHTLEEVDASELEEIEKAALASGKKSEGAKLTHEANAKLKSKVDGEEYACVKDLNEMRVALGLAPLTLDLKLCEAARRHSEDMVKKGFFSHTSPIRGSETPEKRAANAGTSTSGENIAKGPVTGKEANRGWFHSPGHHRIMFLASHERIGVGKAGSTWTQLFGN